MNVRYPAATAALAGAVMTESIGRYPFRSASLAAQLWLVALLMLVAVPYAALALRAGPPSLTQRGFARGISLTSIVVGVLLPASAGSERVAQRAHIIGLAGRLPPPMRLQPRVERDPPDAALPRDVHVVPVGREVRPPGQVLVERVPHVRHAAPMIAIAERDAEVGPTHPSPARYRTR